MCLTGFTWINSPQKCLSLLRVPYSACWPKGSGRCIILKHTIFPSCFLQNKVDFFFWIWAIRWKHLYFFDLAFQASRLRGGKGSCEDVVGAVLLLWREDQGHGLGSWRQINYRILLLTGFVKLQFVRGIGHIVSHSLSIIPNVGMDVAGTPSQEVRQVNRKSLFKHLFLCSLKNGSYLSFSTRFWWISLQFKLSHICKAQ